MNSSGDITRCVAPLCELSIELAYAPGADPETAADAEIPVEKLLAENHVEKASGMGHRAEELLVHLAGRMTLEPTRTTDAADVTQPWRASHFGCDTVAPKAGIPMLLYGYPILDDFATRHSKCRGPLAAWRVEVEDTVWASFADLQRRYLTAASNDSGSVVFNIVPDLCLVSTKVNFVRGIVVVESAWAKRQALRQANSRRAA